MTRDGKPIPLSQIGRIEIQSENPLIKRRDRVPTITVRGDNIETTQPPDVSAAIWAKLAPLRKSLPENYRIEMAGSIEDATKANSALAPLFPIMILFMLAVIIIQVRSFSAMWMVMLTGPLGLIGAVPTLLIFHQSFGFNEGSVFVGTSHDTPAFADASHLLILADSGGSNGARVRAWKYELERQVVEPFGLCLTICLYPTGASKWNPVEHRLFSEISKHWAGQALESYPTILRLIGGTTTQTGLRVKATLVTKHYETGQKVSDEQMRGLCLKTQPMCPRWNYTLTPRENRN